MARPATTLNDSDAMDLDVIMRHIGARYRGRRWIFAADAAAGLVTSAAALREHEPEGIMVVAGIEGVGDLPDADRIFYTRSSGETIMGGFRDFYASVARPSARLSASVDAFDPDGRAMVLDMGFSRAPTLAGRRIYGWRRTEWTDLEDKTVVDDLWSEAGIARADSVVVDVEGAGAVAADLGGDLGTVWVADNREGWHGGGEYTQWIRSPDDAERATAWFRDHAHRVRVMPFLEGLPCSIHGFISRDGIAVFRPVELFILRVPTESRFLYGQGANFWTPPEHITNEMRSAARAVGRALSERVGYLGAFGIDGVATADGFRPTELNPRRTLGHGIHTRPIGIPLDHMERMLLEGDLDVDADDLEATVMEGTEQRRYGGVMFPLTEEHPTATMAYAFDGDSAVEVADDEVPPGADGVMMIGPSAFGSLVIARPDPARTPVGPSFTPRVPQLLDLARRRWGVELPPIEAASDLTQ